LEFTPTQIPDVILITPRLFGDARGFFMETFHASRFAEAGLPTNFVQDNHSGSVRNTLRGLHYQIRQAQGKLVRAAVGEIFDVAVDLRRGSPTFGQWAGEVLSADNRKQLWVPPGFAHGFYVLSEWAEVLYKTTDFYAPEWERALFWNDPQLGIEWPIAAGQFPILSAKDQAGLPLSRAEIYEEMA
jgi:dTDP-4-dehydrorhamnose 3,5-epimerase